MSDVATKDPCLDVKGVLARAFACFKAERKKYLTLAALTVLIPEILLAANTGLVLFDVALALVAVGAMLVGYGAFLRAGLDQVLGGKPASWREDLAAGIGLIWPVVAVSSLTSVGVLLGMLLLVVPGIILACAWFLALPAKINEGVGVIDSFKRSQTLTKGLRLSIFYLLLLYALAYVAIAALTLPFSIENETSLAAALIIGIGGCFLTPFAMIATVVIYDEARKLKGEAAPVAPASPAPIVE